MKNHRRHVCYLPSPPRLRIVDDAPPAGFYILHRPNAHAAFRAFARCVDMFEALAVEAALHAYEATIVGASALPAGAAETYEAQIAERLSRAVQSEVPQAR